MISESNPPKREGPLVSVVIVNWNGSQHLDECLESLGRQTIADRMEIIVVDNGSTDDSLRKLRSRPSVTLIENRDNAGFATACNQGIRAARGELIALLNNDTAVDGRWLAELVEGLRGDEAIAACTSKILSYFDHQIIDNTGHVVFADGLTRGRGRLQRDRGQFEQVEEVFSFSGCAALLRRRALDDVGLLDDAFFAYCEDADLGFRLRWRGWKIVYVPSSVVFHKYSGSTGAFSELKAFLVERNRFWLALKNLPLTLLLATPFLTAARYFWQAFGVFAGKGASGLFARQQTKGHLIRILLRSWAAALRQVPRVWRQRSEIQKARKISSAALWSLMRRFRISAREIALLE